MLHLEIKHFDQLKTEVQAQYLKNHNPSVEEISKWKGIDIIYFQEDLRKVAKGNISEKTFYTYFKNASNTKVPRIDMLNLLSIYAGYVSWYDFKKKHLFANEILADEETETKETIKISEEIIDIKPNSSNEINISENLIKKEQENIVLQNTITDNQNINKNNKVFETYDTTEQKSQKKSIKNYVWGIITGFLVILTSILGFGDHFFDTTYTYSFIDSDRNASIQNTLEIKVIKQNESPIYYRIEPGKSFRYATKDKVLRMEITSPLYENLEINRNLENAPKEEKIQLKPDDYKTAVYYYSKKSIAGNSLEALNLIKQKRNELESRISNNALIYQVFDNDTYGIETMNREKYITLVTTPTTSLKNLSVIDMKSEKGKIVSIKFKIKEDDENQ